MENMIFCLSSNTIFVLKPSRTAILFFPDETQKNTEALAETTNQIENFRRAWKAGWWYLLRKVSSL